MENFNSTASKGITNLEYLINISNGNAKFAWEMIRIFLVENPEEIEVLEKSIELKDFDLIKATAHKLKSTIPFIGLDKVIGHEVSEMERLAESKSDIMLIHALFLIIRDACEKACIELRPV